MCGLCKVKDAFAFAFALCGETPFNYFMRNELVTLLFLKSRNCSILFRLKFDH